MEKECPGKEKGLPFTEALFLSSAAYMSHELQFPKEILRKLKSISGRRLLVLSEGIQKASGKYSTTLFLQAIPCPLVTGP
jgi:hypothetical protein